jgi:putative molybdopterin biosynthesis protein
VSGHTQRSRYLHDIPLDQALDQFDRALQAAGLGGPADPEYVDLTQALGRITAEPVWANRSSPHYHAAAMDGYATRAASTQGASDRNPITLELGQDAFYVDTGAALPAGMDCVIPVELVEPVNLPTGEGLRVMNPAAPWSHVRPMGEDIVATELVIPSGQALGPFDLGAIAASGHVQVAVRRKPQVAIIPTGSELVPLGTQAQAGQILEFNSLMLSAQLESYGAEPEVLSIVPDDLELIQRALEAAAVDHDLVLINAGSSAGSKDYTAAAIAALGEVLVHGVAVRPGHPVVLGMLKKKGGSSQVPVIGVPGYPVSAALTGEIFIAPLIRRWLGQAPDPPEILQAELARKVHSSAGDREYLRVTVGKVGERWIAAPLSRGAGVITSLVRADGIIEIPEGVQGLQANEQVAVQLYRPRAALEHTILALGSHDLTLDLMAQFLAQKGIRLASANLGSLGGLLALGRGEAHIAGSHLLDPASGEYNLAYIERYLPDVPVAVIALVGREQGLIVAPGNPAGIEDLAGLARSGVRYVNRQRGSGTRMLLDFQLNQLGIAVDQIEGYEREEYTHLTVAAAVASGTADAGLAIRAAADALGMDFVPLFHERYDLVIPCLHYHSGLLVPLLELLESEDFKTAVGALPGYDIKPMGKIIFESDNCANPPSGE